MVEEDNLPRFRYKAIEQNFNKVFSPFKYYTVYMSYMFYSTYTCNEVIINNNDSASIFVALFLVAKKNIRSWKER